MKDLDFPSKVFIQRDALRCGTMGKIYYLMGKSSSGRDSLYREILSRMPEIKTGLTLYTTRPIRDGERDGVEYHFVSEET